MLSAPPPQPSSPSGYWSSTVPLPKVPSSVFRSSGALPIRPDRGSHCTPHRCRITSGFSPVRFAEPFLLFLPCFDSDISSGDRFERLFKASGSSLYLIDPIRLIGTCIDDRSGHIKKGDPTVVLQYPCHARYRSSLRSDPRYQQMGVRRGFKSLPDLIRLCGTYDHSQVGPALRLSLLNRARNMLTEGSAIFHFFL